MLGDAFPFDIPEGTGPGDRVIIRMPGRQSTPSPPANEVTYDILYDDGDSEERVPRDRIRTSSASTSSSSSSSSNNNNYEGGTAEGGTSEGGTSEVDNSSALEVGTTVMVDWQNRGQYFPGRIHNVNQPQAQGDGTHDSDDNDDDDENDNDDNSS